MQEQTKIEANKFKEVLNNLDIVLSSDLLDETDTISVQELRKKIKDMLTSLETDIEALRFVNENDFFGTDPIFANQRLKLIKHIQTLKSDFEFEILPLLRLLATEKAQKIKENSTAHLEKGKLPSSNESESWTTEKVLDTTGKLLDQATTAGDLIAKAYAYAKVIGLFVGIPIP